MEYFLLLLYFCVGAFIGGTKFRCVLSPLPSKYRRWDQFWFIVFLPNTFVQHRSHKGRFFPHHFKRAVSDEHHSCEAFPALFLYEMIARKKENDPGWRAIYQIGNMLFWPLHLSFQCICALSHVIMEASKLKRFAREKILSDT